MADIKQGKGFVRQLSSVLYLSTELLIMSRLCSKLCCCEGSSASFISNIKANLIFWGWSKTWLRTASLEISGVSTIRWCMRHCGPTLNCHTPVPHTQTKTSQLFRQELNYTPVPIISDLIPYCESQRSGEMKIIISIFSVCALEISCKNNHCIISAKCRNKIKYGGYLELPIE